MKFAVLGAGSWGSAISMVLNDNGHEVTVYGRNEEYINEINEKRVSSKYLPGIKIDEKINFTSNIENAISGAGVIVLSVSSQAVRSVLEKVKDKISEEVIIVNLSKGIENNSLMTISQIVKELLPQNTFVVLSGPSHAEEVASRVPTALVAASESKEGSQLIQSLLSNLYIRIYTNSDVLGVELGGALKNIIALAAGVIDGMGYGDNTKAALMTRGMSEIALMGEKIGARNETFKGLTGIGDLIVTCTSMHSRNRRCGILLGKGYSLEEALKEIGMVVESVYTIKAAYDLSKKLNVEMPITEELYKVLYENENPLSSLKRLMTREMKSEVEEGLNW
jgi:glycerol-3-phosphate dehydrogenase (NAD(P)+)